MPIIGYLEINCADVVEETLETLFWCKLIGTITWHPDAALAAAATAAAADAEVEGSGIENGGERQLAIDEDVDDTTAAAAAAAEDV